MVHVNTAFIAPKQPALVANPMYLLTVVPKPMIENWFLRKQLAKAMTCQSPTNDALPYIS